MKITKYLHSCLLIEDQEKTILIDPGSYSTPVLDIAAISNLDYLLFTHEHADHLNVSFVKEVVQKFPDVKIITNPSIVAILEKEGIKATSDGDDIVSLEVLTHEKLWDKEPPQNAVFTVFGKLTHPGDCMQFTKTAEILALPLQAPWGSTNQSVIKALELQPKVIIPIHDWQWKDVFRVGMYDRLEGFFEEKGIEFRKIATGKTEKSINP